MQIYICPETDNILKLFGYKSMKIETLIGLALLLLVITCISFDYYLLKKGDDLSERLRSISAGVFFIGMGILLLYYMNVYVVKKAFDLSQNGTETICAVTKSEIVHKIQKGKNSTFHYNTVAYDGHVSVLTLDKSYDVGTKFKIVYSRSNPEISMLGPKKSSFVEYSIAEKGLWKPLIVSLMSILCIFIGLSKFRHFFHERGKAKFV